MHKIKLMVIEPKAAIHSLFPAGDAALESSYIPTRASDHNMLPNGQLTREAKRYDMVNQSNKVPIKTHSYRSPQLSYRCQTNCSNLEMPHVYSLRYVPAINVIIYTCQKLPPTLLSFDLNKYHCNHWWTIYTPPASYYPFLKHQFFFFKLLTFAKRGTYCIYTKYMHLT